MPIYHKISRTGIVECLEVKAKEKGMLSLIENNQVSMMGKIVSEFTFSHKIRGESFYLAEIAIRRWSNYIDYIPVMVSERLIDITQNYIDKKIYVTGQFRSYNKKIEGKTKLELFVFVQTIEFVKESEGQESNQVFLKGYICKSPIYRETPLGREIADLFIAVNRAQGKTDYIPCICWGKSARKSSSFEVGNLVQMCGRIQSREYVKKISETESEIRIAYEISAKKIVVIS